MAVTWFNVSWRSLVTRGAIAIIFGIIAMAWPLSTAIALAMLWGFWALADGIGSFAQAFEKGAAGRVWLVLMGVVSLVAAFFAIFSPAVAAVTLTWILGIWLIVRGVFEIVEAFTIAAASGPRWLLLAGGALSLLLGALFVANPGRAAVDLAFVLGLVALAWGTAFVVMGVMMRSETSAAAAPPGPQAPPAAAT